jgi:cytochrome c oxidase subunit 2
MMMARYDVPDIRWSTLSRPMQVKGETEPAYDASNFARAVRDGVGSDGDELEPTMPRWQLSDAQVRGLIAYLETL